jgi:ABC-type branched-subunit amino acid transport system ATPase component
MEISDRTYVMQAGRIVESGRSSDLLEDPIIRKAYLGD